MTVIRCRRIRVRHFWVNSHNSLTHTDISVPSNTGWHLSVKRHLNVVQHLNALAGPPVDPSADYIGPSNRYISNTYCLCPAADHVRVTVIVDLNWGTRLHGKNGGPAPALVITEDVWPRCVCTGGTCLAYEISRQLGVTIAAEVLDFIANAEPGARLTLQRNQAGITTQVVSAVHSAQPKDVTFDDLFRLRKLLRADDREAVEPSPTPRD